MNFARFSNKWNALVFVTTLAGASIIVAGIVGEPLQQRSGAQEEQGSIEAADESPVVLNADGSPYSSTGQSEFGEDSDEFGDEPAEFEDAGEDHYDSGFDDQSDVFASAEAEASAPRIE